MSIHSHANRFFLLTVLLLGVSCGLLTPAGAADTEAIYDKAYSHFQSRDYDRARNLLEQLLDVSQDSAQRRRARYLLGRTLYNQKKEPVKALKYFYDVYSSSKRDNLTDDAIYFVADILISRLDQPGMGIPYLKTIRESFPESDYRDRAINQLNNLSSAKKARSGSFEPADVPVPRIQLDYEKVQLKQFIASYAKITGKNIIYKPDINGKVSIIGKRGIPIDDLFTVVLRVLESQGYTMIQEEGGVYRVKSTKRALKDGVGLGKKQSGYRTRLFSLGNLSWQEVKQPIQVLLPRRKNLFHMKEINYVGVTAPGSNLKEVQNLLNGLKSIKGPGSEKVVYHYTPQHAQASRLVNKLNSFLPSFLDQENFKLVSVQRSNSVIVAVPREKLPFVKRTIKRFDQVLVDRLRIRTFRLEHAGAKRVAAKLKQLLNVLPSSANREIKIVADERQNAVIVSSVSRKVMSIIERSVEDLDGTDAPSPQQTHVYQVENTKAGPLAEKLNFLFEKDNLNARVTADEQTNSLIFSAPPNKFQSIKDFIKKLDKPKKQILVDAFIAEASNDKVKRLGIEWQVPGSVKGRTTSVGTNFGQRSQFNQGALFGFNTGVFSRSGSQLLGLLTAFSRDEDFRILSTSHLVANENEKASLSVGEIVPILKESQVTEQGSLNRSFSFENVGVDLDITPTISGDSTVTLDILQKIQQLQQQGTSQLGAPQRRNRTLETRVSIPNKQTLVLGGVLSSQSNETDQSVPYLGEIPVLGNLLQSQSKTRNRRNLLIFLTPHILDSQRDIKAATKRLRKEQNANIPNKPGRRIKQKIRGDTPDTPVGKDTTASPPN